MWQELKAWWARKRWQYKRFSCIHVWEDRGVHLRGGTTSPYPAVDERFRLSMCSKCGRRLESFAGFVFDSE